MERLGPYVDLLGLGVLVLGVARYVAVYVVVLALARAPRDNDALSLRIPTEPKTGDLLQGEPAPDQVVVTGRPGLHVEPASLDIGPLGVSPLAVVRRGLLAPLGGRSGLLVPVGGGSLDDATAAHGLDLLPHVLGSQDLTGKVQNVAALAAREAFPPFALRLDRECGRAVRAGTAPATRAY